MTFATIKGEDEAGTVGGDVDDEKHSKDPVIFAFSNC